MTITDEIIPDSQCSAVSVKIPQFTPTDPRWFFMFCEGQFHLRNITQDDTMFYHIACSLSPEISSRVMNVLDDPPTSGKYEALKQQLLKEFTLTNRERAGALLDMPGLGDMKPSQLYAKIRELTPREDRDLVPTFFLFREIFLRQLPTDVQVHLTDHADLPLDKLAEKADQYFLSAERRVCAVKRPEAPQTSRKLCFYHERFGDQARRCRSPCSYVPGN